MPHLLTSFIGREKEIAEISDLIANNRLVMLTGVGGIGKTSLSIQVGHNVLASFADGVWLVELASVMDERLVVQTALYAVGLRESSNRPLLEVLFEFLREKECLLILDNCEHLIYAVAAFVKSALQTCPRLKILANSREILNVPGELPFYVPSLSMPEGQQMPNLEQWQQYEALHLFVTRATTIFPKYQVTDDNLVPLVQICQRLDGIPLALELAAARVKMLTTTQIATRLDQRFRLLTTGNRAALPRHQTLQALVDWSWELLSLNEQLLLRRLSVFAGGMTLAMVTAVCTDDGVQEFEVLDLLTQSVNKSLLIAERKPGKETRYRLLETIRQYGQERLAETAELGRFHQRHLDYFVQLGEQAEKELVGPDQVAWISLLERELDNVRAALNWSRRNNVEKGLQLATGLWKFWEVRGYSREGESWLAQLLAQAETVEPLIRAKTLSVQGALQFNLYNLAYARTLLEESLDIFREVENEKGIAFCLYRLAMVVGLMGERFLEKKYLSESLELCRALGDKLGIADILQWEGSLEESQTLYKELGHLAGTTNVLTSLGVSAMRQGDYVAARSWLEEALALTELLGVQGDVGVGTLIDFGVLLFRLKDYEQARDYLEKGMAIIQKTGENLSHYWAGVHLGHVFLRMGQMAQARALFVESQQRFKEAGTVIGVVFALEGLASLTVGQGQWRQAAKLFAWSDRARADVEDTRPPVEQADVDQDIATIIENIGEAAFTTAYTEGKRMTMEEAITLALGVGAATAS